MSLRSLLLACYDCWKAWYRQQEEQSPGVTLTQTFLLLLLSLMLFSTSKHEYNSSLPKGHHYGQGILLKVFRGMSKVGL